MKKYILLSISVFSAITLGFFMLSNSEAKLEQSRNPKVLAMTTSVEIPEQVSFAGETTPLDRYDLYERYDREINSFTYFHSTTMLLIKRANRIFPIIVPILKANGIPEDLKYLAVIESSLNPRAVSVAKAAGIWQFMPATAKQYGLEITTEVDERYSIEKSTVAACKYLRMAYKKYGNWKDAALSYNGGMGRITGQLETQLVPSGLDLWLVEETARYYFRMVAIKEIFENPYKYGFVISADQLYKPIEFNEVTVSSSINDLVSFAKRNGITYAQLKDFNSWLRDTKLTISANNSKTYTILIPKQESLYYRKGERRIIYDPRWVTE